MAGLARGTRFDIPRSVPEWCKELINDCWNQLPSQRPAFAEIVERLKNSDYILNGVDANVYEMYKKKILAVEGKARNEGEITEETRPTNPFTFS
jgi:hypothetical protein